MHSYVHCLITYNNQDMEEPKYSTIDDWIKRSWYIYTMEYNLAIKNNEIFLFVTT